MDLEYVEDEYQNYADPSEPVADAENEDEADDCSESEDDNDIPNELADLFAQGESLRTDAGSIPLGFESLQIGDTRLTNIHLRRTNRHSFICSCSMIIFSIIPLLVLILDSVYVGHLVWITIAAHIEPLDHSLWKLELSFMAVLNIIGIWTIAFMLVVTMTGKRIHFNLIFLNLLVLVIICTSSCIWGYKESSHTTWFPNIMIGSTIFPQYIQQGNWFTPKFYVQLKLLEITAIFVMIWIWIWNWEQILELHGDQETPTPAENLSTVPSVSPTSETPGPNCRGPYSVKVPRVLTDQDPEPEPPSSSTHGRFSSSVKPGSGFNGAEGDEDTKAETEFREDGDRPGLAQPSRIIEI